MVPARHEARGALHAIIRPLLARAVLRFAPTTQCTSAHPDARTGSESAHASALCAAALPHTAFMHRPAKARAVAMTNHISLTQSAPKDPSDPSANADAIHVLVVDDESVIRTAVRTALEDASYVVHEAADGDFAMDLLLLSPHPMVVVLDLMMPRMSGTQVLELLAVEPVWARRNTVVVLTAMGQWLTSKRLRPLQEQFAFLVIAKPFDVEELLVAVADAARRLPSARA
jgi:CheY-like chemotaxis protein